MGSKELGADLCFAWPVAQIGVMGARGGVEMLFRRDIVAAPDPEAARASFVTSYEETLLSPYIAAERGCIDDIIMPSETRDAVVGALRALRTKRVQTPPKKHSNIPL